MSILDVCKIIIKKKNCRLNRQFLCIYNINNYSDKNEVINLCALFFAFSKLSLTIT